ncbi:MAG: hypothetical protein KatS3mg102_1670 [Planctomycetota bacterium]|nr:MAG: hypothetical protein KatS3mg102_1670 [Planctomycetota bacterium]
MSGEVPSRRRRPRPRSAAPGGRQGRGRRHRGAGAPSAPPPAQRGGLLRVGAQQYRLREAHLAIELGRAGQPAYFDLYAEGGGGARPVTLVLDHVALPGVQRLAQLAGQVVIDPPPHLLLPRGAPAAAPAASLRERLAELARAAAAPGPEPTAAAAEPLLAAAAPPEEDEAEDEGPDDDPALGDLESYRRRRAAEGAAAPPCPEPELEPAAEQRAEAESAEERSVLTPEGGYAVRRLRIAFQPPGRGVVELELHAEADAIGPEGEVCRQAVPVHAQLRAEIDVVG